MLLNSDEKYEEEGVRLDSINIFITQVPYRVSLRSGNLERNDLRLQPSPETKGFEKGCASPGKPVYIGVNIENLPDGMDKGNADVYVYIATANTSNFIKYKVDYKADPGFYGDYYIEIPASFIEKPYFRYYFEAQIHGIEELLKYPNDPFEWRTIAVRDNYPPYLLQGFYGIHSCDIFHLAPPKTFSHNNLTIRRIYYRAFGSNDQYLYADFMEIDKVKDYYVFSLFPRYLDSCDYCVVIPKQHFGSDLEYFYYMETDDGTQGIDDQMYSYSEANYAHSDIGVTQTHLMDFSNNCDDPLTRSYTINGRFGTPSFCRDVIISNITSSNEHFTISPLQSNITLGFNSIVGYYDEYSFSVTYDGKVDATSTITIFSDATQSEYTFNVRGKNCTCVSLSLSSNPITSQSHTLFFTLPKDSQTTIYLTDESGNRITTIPYIFNENLEAGEYEVSLEELFQHNLNPLTPYILVIETEQEKSLMYLYVSKL